jgi:hypothetical protein
MNRKDSRNSTSKSQQKYIKLNLKNFLKGGADEEPEPSPYDEDTMVVDHPYKEEAYDLDLNKGECDQTGGNITIPYDPFAPHDPLKPPFMSMGFPRIIPKQVDNLYPINGPNGGVGFSTVSPTPYRLNPHSFPSNDIQNIKIPIIPSNYMLPGLSTNVLGPIGNGLGPVAPVIPGLGIGSTVVLDQHRFGSQRLKNYLRRVITSLEMLMSRKKYANKWERAHINDQLNTLSRQLSRAIEIYKPTKPSKVDKNLANLLEKVKRIL